MSWKVKYFYFLSVLNAVVAVIGAMIHYKLTWLSVLLAVICWFIAGDIHSHETNPKGDN